MKFKVIRRDISIRAKLFGLIAFLILILVFSGYVLRNTLDKNAQLIEKQSLVIQALSEASNASQEYGRLRWTYFTFLNQPDAEALEKVNVNIKRLQDRVDKLATVGMRSETQELQNRLSSIESTASTLARSGGAAANAEALTQEAMSDLGRIDEILVMLGDHLKKLLMNYSRLTLKQTDTLRGIPATFILGGLSTVIFALLVVILNIFIPISKITRAMKAASLDPASARDYALPVAQNDEIGEATQALNHLFTEVSSGIEKISKTENQLRESGQYLQAIMDNMVDGIVIVSKSGKIESFSPGAEAITGYDALEVLNRDFSEVFVAEEKNRQRVLRHLQSSEGSYQTHTPHELLIQRKDKSYVPVELVIGMTVHAGRPMNIVTVRDISSRRQMEALLNQAQRMETVGRMTGGIAHDFNNMLIVISGNLELIDRRIKDAPELKEMVNAALESVERGRDLTQRLLVFSRKQILKPKTINVNEALPDILELIRRVVREDMAIHTNLAPDLWNVHVDPAQLESAILNMAINSRDAIEGAGGKIVIETKNVLLGDEADLPASDFEPGAYVMVSLSDNGSGIPKDVIDRVFDPFFTTKDVGKGTGLGLSMVYGFTRQSGGYVAISSEEGKGTTIRLYFPRTVEKAEAAPVRPPARPEDEITGGSESVLIVEDKPDVLSYLSTTLRELGYRVTQAKDGPSALKRLQNRKNLDILVTDVVMPGQMNGEQLAMEVRKQFPDTKILYISGYTQDALVDQGALKPGVNLLSKPFTRADLAHRIRGLLDGSR